MDLAGLVGGDVQLDRLADLDLDRGRRCGVTVSPLKVTSMVFGSARLPEPRPTESLAAAAAASAERRAATTSGGASERGACGEILTRRWPARWDGRPTGRRPLPESHVEQPVGTHPGCRRDERASR